MVGEQHMVGEQRSTLSRSCLISSFATRATAFTLPYLSRYLISYFIALEDLHNLLIPSYRGRKGSFKIKFIKKSL